MTPRTPSLDDDETLPAGAPAELDAGQTLARAPGPRLGASPAELATVTASPRARPAPTSVPITAPTTGPGAKVGRFTVLERLGAGGMGVVYAAYDPKLDRRVALKVLRSDTADEDGEARLVREAQAMARVSHPNVIPVFEVGAFAGQVYVAMEYVSGVTLRHWLTTPRTVEEVLAVFEPAGRGLAAAHAAGLVHRDFKPANVMIGDDGRVRVLDFGLARPLSRARDDATDPVTDDDGRRDVVLDAQITRTGIAMGTPAYMAPEQIEAGAPLDAKSDQFAFCVALYEALYGQPPFSGTTLTARLAQIEQGRLREPADRKVPRPLREALARGLAARPSARFESMDALLLALRPPVSRRRAVVGGAVVVASLAGLLTWAIVRGHEPTAAAPAPCRDAATPMEALWSPARQTELQASFSAAEAELGPAAWAGVAPRVDAYVASGAALRVAACEATFVQGTQSVALLDRRVACLDRGRRELDALLEVWARADADAIASAARAVSELPALEPCEDLEALLQGVAPPDDALAGPVEATRERLAALRAEERAGHYRDALAPAERELIAVAGVPYPPLHAEALLVAGRLWLRRGRYREARERLERAWELGLGLRHDEVAIEAASVLTLMYSEELNRSDDALAWLRNAEALVQRSGASGAARRNLVRLRGLVHGQRGELERALALHEESLRQAEAALGANDHECAMAHHNLGNALDALGRPAEARAHYERARVIFEALGGPEHPDVALAIQGVADLDYAAGKLDEARALYQRAYDIRVRASGTGTLVMAALMSRLAVVAIAQRRFDDAIAMATRSVEIGRTELGSDNLQVGRLLNNLAMAHVRAGQLEPAEAANAEMLAIFERHLSPDDALLAAARSNLAALRFERGDREGALVLLRRVLDATEQALGPEHPRVANALDKLGAVLVAMDRSREAVPLHERALTIRRARQGSEHLHTAETLSYLAEALTTSGEAARAIETCTELLALESKLEAPELMANGRFILAHARWAAGEPAAARAEAAKARAAFEAIGMTEGVTAVNEWLAER